MTLMAFHLSVDMAQIPAEILVPIQEGQDGPAVE